MTSAGTAPEGAGEDAALAAPFRPRLARRVTLTVGAAFLALTVVLVLVMPGLGPGDVVGFLLFGLAVAWFCWRQASVRAVPDERGLLVRNLLLTRHVTWAEVVSVRFGQGRPWVQLDLADGDTLAVMGVQRADGTFAEQEARRLATLVARRSATPHDA
ncbi:PH domain-containing protein [Cellulomonas shaoxiangyii]|uniref:PH domain-containing protein n=1 Tax=Cellulomonas shaoxiangyii TaxID=2566013 RepID=A0A4P7SHT5_9CELL|nr:PH domain-containing protein [Cellulomonas shaoxiangyii]QCB93612.1 PH domain-containing protein [Cellulomonas shaoxiangyii]TGY85684.1 PH domain-containing protein [Cellulomonas shaoxiangyii]